ncbi:family 16 glycoside hydrolase [Cohnella sp.]|uniref:family 16 glycoside hydrolase n=1 Tax=Cohnella sp. TaxID=1883426 RepID=UPI003565B2DE
MKSKALLRGLLAMLAVLTVITALPITGASPAWAAGATDGTASPATLSTDSGILFVEEFDDAVAAAARWKEVPAQWTAAVDGGISYLRAVHNNTRTFLLPPEGADWTDYEAVFRAKFSNLASGRAEFFVRSDASGNFYSIEAQTSADKPGEATFKIHRWQGTVYQGNLTANVVYAYNPTEWHEYKITVKGNAFALQLDGEQVIAASDAASHYGRGSVGMRSNNVGLLVDRVEVRELKDTGEPGFEPYASDFESASEGAVPSGWTVRGDAKAVRLPEGNMVFRLNGQAGKINPTATLSHPDYAAVDNFSLKFRAKYVRTSDESYNVWRLRYRARNDANNYSMEWGTHNWRYFIMRKTDLGGNYFLGTYNEALDNRWIDYEIRVSGITHELFINGNRVIGVDDFDTLRMESGYIQFGTVNGIDLMIDSIELAPLAPQHIYNIEPAGNYTGIYGPEEQPGLKVHLSGGAEDRRYEVSYRVRKADGDKALVATGSRSFELEAYGTLDEELYFDTVQGMIGTYDVFTELSIDGEATDNAAKTMRMAVVREVPPTPEIDFEMESKFGFNTHYKTNWRDDMMDAVRKTGARHHRSALNLEETFTGQYDGGGNPIFNFAASDAYLDKVASFGLNSIPILGFVQDTTRAASYEGLKLTERFVQDTVYRYRDQVTRFETPNEPELFVKPYIPYEIVQQWKRAYIGAKKGNFDTTFIAGDHTSSVRSVLPAELDLGAYYYADAFSWHPYVYNAMPDGAIESFVYQIGDMINPYGGWKDFYLTEGGWPTAKGGFPNVTEEVQRDYIMRAFLIYMTMPQVRAWEYYNFKNDGTDENYYEIFWGVTDVDGRPKLAYNAANTMMTTLDKVDYIGPLDTGDTKNRAYVFMKDYKPIIAAWRSVDHKDNPATVPATSQWAVNTGKNEVTLRDVNGRDSIVAAPEGVANVTLTGSPIYILGSGSEVLHEAASRLREEYYAAARQKLAAAAAAGHDSAAGELIGTLDGIDAGLEAAMKAQTPEAQAADLEQGVIGIYALMKAAAAQAEQGRLQREPAFVAMEALYNYAEAAAKALVQVNGEAGAATEPVPYEATLEQAQAAYEQKAGEHHLLAVSTAALMRANRYGRLAELNRERGDFAQSYGYALLARELAGAAEAIAAAEKPLYTGVWLNVTPIRASGEPGYSNRITGTVANETNEPQTVTVSFDLPDGWGDAPLQTVDIEPHGVYRFDLPLPIPVHAQKGTYTPKVTVERQGERLDEAAVELRVSDAISARILPATKPAAELDRIVLQLKGSSPFAKTGKTVLTGPDGKALEPVAGDTFANLALGETVELAFRWDYPHSRNFNDYRLDVTVTDTDNQLTIFKDEAMPLDFLLIEKAPSTVVIDGSFEEWASAYPVHLRGVERNNTGVYDPDNLDATAYAMWDEDHLYLAVDVTDSIHKNAEDAPNLWKNDSLQFSIDPLGDSSAAYNADDTEWGFARHDNGQHLANIFFSRPPNPNGNASSLLDFRIVRDEDSRKTRYEIKLPRTMIHHLQLAEGVSFPMNYAVNDADFQMGRDNFIQWTRGLADGKNPSLYDRFTLVVTGTVEPELPVDGTRFVLSAERDIVESGEEIGVIVSAEEADDLYGIDLQLEYDSDRLELLDVELIEPFAGETGGYASHAAKDGKVRIVASRTGAVSGINGHAPLLKLRFKALLQQGLSQWRLPAGSGLSNSEGVLAAVAAGKSLTAAVTDSTAITGNEPSSDAIVLLAKSLGRRSGEVGYNALYDMNKDGVIDIIDISYVALRILK